MNDSIHSLCGLRILNTRPEAQAKALTLEMKKQGGIVIELPMLKIEPLSPVWLHTLPNLEKVQQAIFISTNAVHIFFNTIKKHQILWNSNIKTIAIGAATADSLREWSNASPQTPAVENSEHLLALPSLRKIKQQKILLVKGEGGRLVIEDELNTREADLHILHVYQRIMPAYPPNVLQALWQSDSVDIILFTSQQTMQNLFTQLGKEAAHWLQHKPCMVISERLAKKASSLGIRTVILSRYDTILATLQEFKQGFFYGNQQ